MKPCVLKPIVHFCILFGMGKLIRLFLVGASKTLKGRKRKFHTPPVNQVNASLSMEQIYHVMTSYEEHQKNNWFMLSLSRECRLRTAFDLNINLQLQLFI